MRRIPGKAIGLVGPFDYVTGQAYSSPGWISNADGQGNMGSKQFTTGNLFASPFYLPQTVTIDQIGVYITGVSGAMVRIGIYNDQRFVRLPGNLVVGSGEIACDTSGVKTQTLTPPITLRGGRIYWASLTPSVSTLYFRTTPAPMIGFEVNAGNSYSGEWNGIYRAFTFGTLPDPWGTPVSYFGYGTFGQGVLLYMRIVPSAQGASAYMLGGGWDTDRIETMEFLTETVMLLSALLPSQHLQGSACNSATKGYIASNFDVWYPTTLIDAVTFLTNTSAYTGVALSPHRSRHGAVNSASYGYWGGGETGSDDVPRYAVVSEIDGIKFSDHTWRNPSATLAVARRGNGVTVNSSAKGYWMGGQNYDGSIRYTEIDGIQFSDETAINPSAVLPTTISWGAGFNSATRGYCAGGYTATALTKDICRFEFSDETITDIAAELAGIARSWGGNGGANSNTRGYCLGGENATWYSEIDGLLFSDETAINPAASLTNANEPSACQSGGIL